MNHMATVLEHMGTNTLQCMGLECMGPALGTGIEHMSLAMGGSGSVIFDCAI